MHGQVTAIDPDPLDRLAPAWLWRSRSTAILPTSPRRVFTALRSVTLRELPTAASQRRVDASVTFIDDLVGQGFVPLAEPDETALLLGRPGPLWHRAPRPARPVGGWAVSDGAAGAPSGPGGAVLMFAARPFEGETVLVAEAGLWAGATDTRHVRSRHWLVASWARQLTQRELVEAVRRRLGLTRLSDLSRRLQTGRRPG